MTSYKRILTIAVIAVLPALSAYAQKHTAKIYQRREIVEMENDEGDTTFEVFAMDGKDGGSEYFINLGHMGFGNHTVQVNLDPVFTLSVKLGDSLSEAIASLEKYKDQVKASPGTASETLGYLNFGVPGDNPEKVTVTTRKPLVSRYLEFSIEREGYLRVATIPKSDIGGLLLSLKAYKKIHKKEK